MKLCIKYSIALLSIAATIACTSTNAAGFKFEQSEGAEKQLEEPYFHQRTTRMLTNFASKHIDWIVRSEAHVREYNFKIFSVGTAKGPIVGYTLGLRVKYVEGISPLEFHIMPATPIVISKGIAEIETKWVGRNNNEELLCVFRVDGEEHSERMGIINYMHFYTYRVIVPKGKHIELVAFEIRQANPVSSDTWYYYYFTDIAAIETND